MRTHLIAIATSLISLMSPFPVAAEPHSILKKLNIEESSITISGLSSGAFMAVQMEVAFSKTLSGAGSIGGGTYWCAQGDTDRAQSTCLLHPERIDTQEILQKTQQLAQQNLIDPLIHLKNHRIYIFAGTNDTRVLPHNSVVLEDFLLGYIPATQIRMDNTLPAAHGLPTLDYGQACDQQASPWLLNCGYDGAGETLKTLYGNLKNRSDAKEQNLHTFSQEEFGDSAAALYPYGWIYIPEACQKGEPCKLHLALHGCKMNPEFIHDEFVRHSGYNAWAEANRMVILYPQAARVDFINPYACWDWFGYTGKNYVTKKGPQMAALKAMIDRLRGF